MVSSPEDVVFVMIFEKLTSCDCDGGKHHISGSDHFDWC